MEFEHLDWDEIQRLSEEVAEMVKRSGFRPDLIVAVSRGGFPPARIISDVLDVRALASVSIIYYRSVGERHEEPVIIHPLNADVRGKRVLIVDDVADSGHSLLLARRHVLEKGASEVRIATLHYKPWSALKPDYYVRETKSWIVYPWEKWEVVRQEAEKLRKQGKSNEDIVRGLVEKGFDEGFVRKVLGL